MFAATPRRSKGTCASWPACFRPLPRASCFSRTARLTNPTVSYADTRAVADAQRALAILLADHDVGEPVLTRAPKLDVPLDGPARLHDVHRALTTLSAQAAKRTAPIPALLRRARHPGRKGRDQHPLRPVERRRADRGRFRRPARTAAAPGAGGHRHGAVFQRSVRGRALPRRRPAVGPRARRRRGFLFGPKGSRGRRMFVRDGAIGLPGFFVPTSSGPCAATTASAAR